MLKRFGKEITLNLIFNPFKHITNEIPQKKNKNKQKTNLFNFVR